MKLLVYLCLIALIATVLAVEPTNQPLLSRLRLQQGTPAATAQPATELPIVPGLNDTPFEPEPAKPADKPADITPPAATDKPAATPPASNTLVEKPVPITDLTTLAKTMRVPLETVNRTVSGADKQVLLLQPRTDSLPEVFSFVEGNHVHFIAQQWSPSDNTTKVHSAWVREVALPTDAITRRGAENMLYRINKEADYSSRMNDILPAFKQYYDDFFRGLRRFNDRMRDVKPFDWLSNQVGLNRDAYGLRTRPLDDDDDDFDDD